MVVTPGGRPAFTVDPVPSGGTLPAASRPEPPSAAETPGLDAAELGVLLDSAADPLELRRHQVALASAHPDLAVPEPRQIIDDLREAMRQARAGLDDLSVAAARRYRVVELLLRGTAIKAAASAESVSSRTLYRARAEALTELAPVVTAMWRRASQAPPTHSDLHGAQAAELVEGIPIPPLLVGRDAELDEAEAWLHEHRLLLVGGPAGIGKTAFAAALAHREGMARPVLWLQLRRGLSDSMGGVLFAVARRLSALGSDALSVHLREAPSSLPWHLAAESLAAHGLDEHGVLLVLDAAETLAQNTEVCGLVEGILASTRRCAAVVASRERLPLLSGGVGIELGGLDADSVAEHLRACGVAGVSGQLAETLACCTGGSPQLVHLAAGALICGELDRTNLAGRLLDVRNVQAYFFDHIHQQLSCEERHVLGATSLVRVPEPSSFLAAALDGLVASVPATLAALGRRYLLTYGVTGLRLHASVRELTRSTLAVGERRQLSTRLALAYQRGGRLDEAAFHWLEAGAVAEARTALMAAAVDASPQLRERLRPLARRLLDLVPPGDTELAQVAAALGGDVPQPRPRNVALVAKGT